MAALPGALHSAEPVLGPQDRIEQPQVCRQISDVLDEDRALDGEILADPVHGVVRTVRERPRSLHGRFRDNRNTEYTGREVVVFDTQFTSELASRLVEQIRSVTSSPIRYAVVTHPNPDKFNGAAVLRAAGARIVASEATVQAIPGVPDRHAICRSGSVDTSWYVIEVTY